ncbi:ABC transporter permease [Vallitalea sediminicola]
MISWELKKIFKAKIGLIIIALFIFLSGIMFLIKPTLETENSYRDENYRLVIDTRPKQEIAQEKYNNKIIQMKQIADVSENDEVVNNFSNKVKEQLKNIKYEEYKDVDFYKVMDYKVDYPLMSAIIIIILILIFSNIYTDEKISGVDNIILSSKNKLKALYSKVALAVTLPIVLYSIYLLVTFIITMVQYGLPVNGELGVFRISDMGFLFNKAYTINEYLLLKIMTMTGVFISISVAACFFSLISSTSLASISAVLIFMGLGRVCTLMKFLPYPLLSILTKGNYEELILYPDRFIGMYAGEISILGRDFGVINVCNVVLIATIFTGILFSVLAIKKKLNR